MSIRRLGQFSALLITAVLPLTCVADDENTSTKTVTKSVKVTVNSSSSQSSEEAEPTTTVNGKIVIEGPDGQRQEYDLGEKLPGNLKLNLKNITDGVVISGGGIVTEDESPRFMIGVICQPADSVLRSQLKLDGTGIVVTHVSNQMPAADVGIEVGDILLGIDDQLFRTVADLVTAVAECNGKPLKVRRLHNGEVSDIEITPKKATNNEAISALIGQMGNSSLEHALGSLKLSPAHREAMKRLCDKHHRIVIQSFGPAIELGNAEDIEASFAEIISSAKNAAKAASSKKTPVASDDAKDDLRLEMKKLKQRMKELEKQIDSSKDSPKN